MIIVRPYTHGRECISRCVRVNGLGMEPSDVPCPKLPKIFFVAFAQELAHKDILERVALKSEHSWTVAKGSRVEGEVTWKFEVSQVEKEVNIFEVEGRGKVVDALGTFFFFAGEGSGDFLCATPLGARGGGNIALGCISSISSLD